MTRIPSESWDVTAMTGDLYPKYKVKPMCAHPNCTRFVDHVHHIVRRSFIGGDIAWVKFGNGDIVGNLCGLCYAHHEEITNNEAMLLYEERLHQYTWAEPNSKHEPVAVGALYPHPPVHGHNHDEDESGEPAIIGPGSNPICPGCHRPIPRKKEKDEKIEQAKRRKTWTVRVPDEATEDGALVLDTLVAECADMFGRENSPRLRYYVLAQALALVIQHAHLLSDSDKRN